MDNKIGNIFFYTWLSLTHSLFFVRQYWARFWYSDYFDTIEKHPLTTQQRQAVIVNERRNLVIAGAGTGKTSVVVGKVGYLVKSGKVRGDEILVIAYNRKARDELRERIEKKLNIKADIHTFHSFGRSILAQTDYPSLPHEFVDQEEKFFDFLDHILQQCLEQADFSDLYFEYFKKHEFENIDEIRAFKTQLEYANWLRVNKLITLNNERVKSHGELLIANFLYCNGIEYKYEDFYSANNSMPNDSYHRPDFYLPKYKIYIEYFGIDENGNTAPFVPKDEYNESIKWKKETHKLGNTTLIDLYYYQNKRGALLDNLEKHLSSYDVKFVPRPKKDLFAVINSTKKDKRFLELIASFISQFKERQHDFNLDKLRAGAGSDERTLLFLKIFETILSAYQQELDREKKIDFGDMISESAILISRKEYFPNYKYIIIDEFQDISDGRHNLINQILIQNRKTKLFCVGDDWQSIYRFSGANNKIMSHFSDVFGESTILRLDKTFRYNNQIASMSEQFITRNPNQIKKNLKTLTSACTPQVFVHWHSDTPHESVLTAIKLIQDEYTITTQELLILSRYNHNKFKDDLLKSISDSWQGILLPQDTVHAAKGLEADFVIVSDLKSNNNGFPTEVQDDSIMNLVLPSEDSFEDAEERRLFYVAITRAKHQVHLICDSVYRSRFADELIEEDYPVIEIEDSDPNRKCPVCSDGFITKKTSFNGDYYSCCNYPLCNFRPLLCLACEESLVFREKTDTGVEIAICQSDNCDTRYEICEHCSVGIYRQIEIRDRVFLGCHDYPRTRCKGSKNI